MATLRLRLSATGFGKVIAVLQGNIDRANNLTTPMKQGADLMMESIASNFSSGGRPAWVPLSAKYLARKVAKGYSSTPLTRTGDLKASIGSEVNSMGFRLGTSLPYSRIHQKGGNAGRNHASFIPKRPYLVFQESDIEKINQSVVDYIREGS